MLDKTSDKSRVRTNKWGKADSKGPLGLDWSGCYPCTVIPFKDKSCKEVDEDAFRSLVRDLLESDIAGIDPILYCDQTGDSTPWRIRDRDDGDVPVLVDDRDVRECWMQRIEETEMQVR